MDIDLSQNGVAGIHEAVWRLCRYDCNRASNHSARLITNNYTRAAFEHNAGPAVVTSGEIPNGLRTVATQLLSPTS